MRNSLVLRNWLLMNKLPPCGHAREEALLMLYVCLSETDLCKKLPLPHLLF